MSANNDHDVPQPKMASQGQPLKLPERTSCLPAYSPIFISSSKASLKPSPELRRSRRPSMNYNISIKSFFQKDSILHLQQQGQCSHKEVTQKGNENTKKKKAKCLPKQNATKNNICLYIHVLSPLEVVTSYSTIICFLCNKESNEKQLYCKILSCITATRAMKPYLLEELELNGVLKELPHDCRTVGHKCFFTKSDGFALQNSED